MAFPDIRISENPLYHHFNEQVRIFVDHATNCDPSDPHMITSAWNLFSFITKTYSALYNAKNAELGTSEITGFLEGKIPKPDRHLIDFGIIYFVNKTGIGQGSAPFRTILELEKDKRQKATDFFLIMKHTVYTKLYSLN
jgi:hypothetical protein